MRRMFGICCIALGICCLLAAIGLIAHNHLEAQSAQTASESLLQDVRETMEDTGSEEPAAQDAPAEITANIPQEMPTAQVDGYDCIGVLSIPVLGLDLPVLTDWSYAKLKIAPCLYFGSYFDADFVIAAHNYASHFGRLSELQEGDLILFTDISGTVHCYEVALLETLPPNATEEMITSGFALSLYTCTPGGGSRVTVRCTAAE